MIHSNQRKEYLSEPPKSQVLDNPHKLPTPFLPEEEILNAATITGPIRKTVQSQRTNKYGGTRKAKKKRKNIK